MKIKGGEKVNSKIEKLLKDYCNEGKDPIGEPKNAEELLETLRNFSVLHKEMISEHRWWNEYRYTIKIKGTYIGYIYAETTGDMSASEAGYDFDPDSICEMEQIKKTITTYIKK